MQPDKPCSRIPLTVPRISSPEIHHFRLEEQKECWKGHWLLFGGFAVRGRFAPLFEGFACSTPLEPSTKCSRTSLEPLSNQARSALEPLANRKQIHFLFLPPKSKQSPLNFSIFTPSMITIYVEQITPRITYTLKLIFEEILNSPFQIALPSQSIEKQTLALNYTRQNIPGTHSIPVSGLLYEEIIRDSIPEIHASSLQLLFPGEVPRGILTFDPFAAIFYLATEYAFYSSSQTDAHGRHEEQALPYLDQGLYATPLCHQYALLLWERLLEINPGLQGGTAAFSYELTIDIDHPWKYKHKGLLINAGGAVKELSRFRFRNLGERLGTLLGRKDPYEGLRFDPGNLPSQAHHSLFSHRAAKSAGQPVYLPEQGLPKADLPPQPALSYRFASLL